jgi:thiamine-phosphate pyrophosphorylase
MDLIQLRERDLEARALLELTRAVQERIAGTPARLLINDRLDVALAAGAAGVHLPARGLPAEEVRREFPELLVGVSTHNLDELRRAEQSGADFAVFGPVFETASKKEYGPPLGVERFAEATQAVKIPVLAVGGVTLGNAPACFEAGAAGIAAITLFQASADLANIVRQLRGAARGARGGV